MTVVGIIAEYDPFHKGHLHHLQETLRLTGADCVVAVMSGSFTQRGEPAAFDKWLRTEMALQNGVDLVIELPFYYACNQAAEFADGAVGILDRLGGVDVLSFGSECGEIAPLEEAAVCLAEEGRLFQKQLRLGLDSGLAYGKARTEALAAIRPKLAELLRQPNNLLGIEYLISCRQRNSKMKALTIPRRGSEHSDVSLSACPSATAIRRHLREQGRAEDLKEVLPQASWELIRDRQEIKRLELADFYEILAARILLAGQAGLENIYSAGEGLANRLCAALDQAADLAGLIRLTKTSRYTEARVRRLSAHIISGLTKERFYRAKQADAAYARILGFSLRGRSFLKKIKKEKSSRLPVLTNIHRGRPLDDPAAEEMLAFDLAVSELCHFLRYGRLAEFSDHRRSPVHRVETASF
ncbi:MAG TPA: nucleotidyltransferase [Clostridiales bacterium]|jgi:predicted nucleotidyltransferase|nr:nucleotidyltransferase [Clostridiales bacterium]